MKCSKPVAEPRLKPRKSIPPYFINCVSMVSPSIAAQAVRSIPSTAGLITGGSNLPGCRNSNLTQSRDFAPIALRLAGGNFLISMELKGELKGDNFTPHAFELLETGLLKPFLIRDLLLSGLIVE